MSPKNTNTPISLELMEKNAQEAYDSIIGKPDKGKPDNNKLKKDREKQYL